MFWLYGVVVATTLIGLTYYYLRHVGVFWAFAPVAIAYLTFGFAGPKAVTADKEYLSWWASEVGYKEDEWVTETYTDTDSKGRSVTKTRTVYHPPEYWIRGGKIRRHITKDKYVGMATSWGHQPATSILSGRTHKYFWGGQRDTGEVLTEPFYFENKPANSPSVWKYPELGYEDTTDLVEWSRIAYQKRWLDELNADFGHAYQVRVNLIILNNPDSDAGQRQEIYWKGGKKNELNICVGIYDGLIQWCHIFSWSESEGLKTALRYHIMNFGLDRLEAELRERIPTEWKRKEFADFNYIDIPHPTWCYYGFAITCLLISVSTCFIVLKVRAY